MMSLEELLAQAQAIIKDETVMKEPIVAAVQPTQMTWSSPGMSPFIMLRV